MCLSHIVYEKLLKHQLLISALSKKIALLYLPQGKFFDDKQQESYIML